MSKKDVLIQYLRLWTVRSWIEREGEKKEMSSELDSSLTSIDWLPQLGISSLRSGRERTGGAAEREKKKDRGRERADFLPLVPEPSSSNCKGKPPHSYATLIAMAIAAAPERKLSLNDIYTWISNTFPYYSRAGRGWKVSSGLCMSCTATMCSFSVTIVVTHFHIICISRCFRADFLCLSTEFHSSQSVSE